MNNIKQLLDLNLEIEGLLRVAEIHNSEAIGSLLLSKAKKFLEILNSEIDNDKKADSVCDIPTDSCSVISSNDPCSEPSESHSEITLVCPTDNDTNLQTDEPVIDESQGTNYEETETILEMSDDAMEKQEEGNVPEITPPLFIPYLHQQHNERESLQYERDMASEDNGHVMRVDEMIHRQSSRNLKNAFSINDRFRYVREIFGNDSVYFDQTLKHLDTLSNIDEVYDYLLGEMNLNHDDPTVKEFLSIVFNHFNV